MGSQKVLPLPYLKVLEFGLMQTHGAKPSPGVISQSDGPWQENGLQGRIKLYWRVFKEIRTTFVFFSTPPVSSWISIICLHQLYFVLIALGRQKNQTILTFWQMYEQQRLFCKAILLLLLSSFELGL